MKIKIKNKLSGHFGKTVSGSFTVEASIIIPLIIFLMITVMYIGFHFHNQAVMKNYCRYVTEMASAGAFAWISAENKELDTGKEYADGLSDNWKEHFEEEMETIRENIVSDFDQLLLMGAIENYDLNYRYHPLTGCLTCEMTVTGKTVFPVRMFDRRGLDFTVESKSVSYDHIKVLWKMDMLKNGDENND